MTADSAFGLGALPNRAMQVMQPQCLHPGAPLSTTLEYEADPTLENEATGSSSPSLPRLGF